MKAPMMTGGPPLVGVTMKALIEDPRGTASSSGTLFVPHFMKAFGSAPPTYQPCVAIKTGIAAVASLAITGRTGVKALLARYGAPLDLLSRGLALLGGMLLMAAGLYELSA